MYIINMIIMLFMYIHYHTLSYIIIHYHTLSYITIYIYIYIYIYIRKYQYQYVSILVPILFLTGELKHRVHRVHRVGRVSQGLHRIILVVYYLTLMQRVVYGKWDLLQGKRSFFSPQLDFREEPVAVRQH